MLTKCNFKYKKPKRRNLNPNAPAGEGQIQEVVALEEEEAGERKQKKP